MIHFGQVFRTTLDKKAGAKCDKSVADRVRLGLAHYEWGHKRLMERMFEALDMELDVSTAEHLAHVAKGIIENHIKTHSHHLQPSCMFIVAIVTISVIVIYKHVVIMKFNDSAAEVAKAHRKSEKARQVRARHERRKLRRDQNPDGENLITCTITEVKVGICRLIRWETTT